MFQSFNQKETVSTQGRGNGFRFAASVVSDVGILRSNNEDNYALIRSMNRDSADHSEARIPAAYGGYRMAAVFDGMGGGDQGELASHDTAKFFLAAFNRVTQQTTRQELDMLMRAAFLAANNRIVGLQSQYQIFGTTGTVLCTDSREFKLYHLGDSRAYLLRDGVLMQLTKDQTLAQMKLEVGMYAPDDPQVEADKHKLTEYIGRDWTRKNIRPVESLWIPIQAGDRLLLCSDGLYDMCPDSRILELMLSTPDIGRQADALVEAALQNGGADNVTCMIVEFSQ